MENKKFFQQYESYSFYIRPKKKQQRMMKSIMANFFIILILPHHFVSNKN